MKKMFTIYIKYWTSNDILTRKTPSPYDAINQKTNFTLYGEAHFFSQICEEL